MLSSRYRASKPPGRKLVKTASHPCRPARRFVVVVKVRSRPLALAIFWAMLLTIPRRSSLRSINTTSEPSKFSPWWTNEAIVPAARVLPPPMYASLMRAIIATPFAYGMKQYLSRHRENSASSALHLDRYAQENAACRHPWREGNVDESGTHSAG